MKKLGILLCMISIIVFSMSTIQLYNILNTIGINISRGNPTITAQEHYMNTITFQQVAQPEYSTINSGNITINTLPSLLSGEQYAITIETCSYTFYGIDLVCKNQKFSILSGTGTNSCLIVTNDRTLGKDKNCLQHNLGDIKQGGIINHLITKIKL